MKEALRLPPVPPLLGARGACSAFYTASKIARLCGELNYTGAVGGVSTTSLPSQQITEKRGT